MGQFCTIVDCGKPRLARGWCQMHYNHWRQYGGPLLGKMYTPFGEALNYFDFWVNEWTEDCMIWPYNLDGRGYGSLKVNGKLNKVHVLACIYHHGPKPNPKMNAAHGPCHTRACWNGRHLSWKTPTENHADKLRDGTDNRGEKNNTAILTEQEVLAIRREVEVGVVPRKDLAKLYGVAQETINNIVHRRTWKHI